MPLDPALRRHLDLVTLRDFAAELEQSLASGDLDEVGRQSADYHLRVARESIAALEAQAQEVR